jgi:hypothetical protein
MSRISDLDARAVLVAAALSGCIPGNIVRVDGRMYMP